MKCAVVRAGPAKVLTTRSRYLAMPRSILRTRTWFFDTAEPTNGNPAPFSLEDQLLWENFEPISGVLRRTIIMGQESSLFFISVPGGGKSQALEIYFFFSPRSLEWKIARKGNLAVVGHEKTLFFGILTGFKSLFCFTLITCHFEIYAAHRRSLLQQAAEGIWCMHGTKKCWNLHYFQRPVSKMPSQVLDFFFFFFRQEAPLLKNWCAYMHYYIATVNATNFQVQLCSGWRDFDMNLYPLFPWNILMLHLRVFIMADQLTTWLYLQLTAVLAQIYTIDNCIYLTGASVFHASSCIGDVRSSNQIKK